MNKFQVISEVLADLYTLGLERLQRVEAGILDTLLDSERTEKQGVGSSWRRFRKYKKRGRHPKKWLCCGRPSLKKTRRGRRIWMATCKYVERRGKKGAMAFVVGKDPKVRPREITLKGKKMRRCRV